MDRGSVSLTTLVLISDFNVAPLERYLTEGAPRLGYRVEVAPFGQVWQSLSPLPADRGASGSALVWVRPESICPSFLRAVELWPIDFAACLQELDVFIAQLKTFASGKRSCFVASLVPADASAGYGLLDWRPSLGIANLLAQMNLHLAQALGDRSNVFVLDTRRWLAAAAKPHSRKLYYAAKVPFANEVFREAANDLEGAFGAITGTSRRLVVVDLDNTLWGGEIGDIGWQGIRLGGHDHVGEAYQDFQRALKRLTRRGVQLAIVSKNEESVALEALDSHPEMILRRQDFSAWRINWGDKAGNVRDVLNELRLGAASAVFVDDNPAERDRVRGALPDVLVPDWPDDPCAFVSVLDGLRCFDSATVSDEDRHRAEMYQAERVRSAAQISSEGDWLARLDTRVVVERVTNANIARVEQLFNKTNQLNLTTRRMSAAQLLDRSHGENTALWGLTVSDKFGHMGLTGVVGVEYDGQDARLVDYLLSCRVMGRNVEETMLHVAVEQARQFHAAFLVASYVPTARNAPTLQVFRKSGLTERSPNTFVWDCGSAYPKPEHVAVENAG